MNKQALLEIIGLKTCYHTYGGVVRSVDGVDLAVGKGEVVGLVGESGCGKSVTVRSVLRLIAEPGRIEAGCVLFKGEDVLAMSESRLRRLRGGAISMIFQAPLTSLNPVFTIGSQVGDVIRRHQGVGARQAAERACDMFSLVRLPDARALLRKYPHELSGGQLQRVMIAMALSCRPDLLIADEPTTALDVTIQAQILALMQQLRQETGASILLITHDLGVVAETCDRAAVMYAGVVVEEAPTPDIFTMPVHPYTESLLASIPALRPWGQPLHIIPGSVPDLINPPPGCRFHPRCHLAKEVCAHIAPELTSRGPGRRAACHIR